MNVSSAALPLVDWLEKNEGELLSVWDREWTEMLQKGDKDELETYLTDFCFSLIDLDETDQLFVAKTVFISIITDLLRVQSKKEMLQPQLLQDAYTMIGQIERWQNITEYLLNIPKYVEMIVDNMLFFRPRFSTCPQLERAITFINDNITSRRLSVTLVAKHVGISTTHLSNLFRLKMDTNASEYIANRKVVEITYDIVHTSMPLAEIRKKYGFVSHSHFIQFFKRHKGKTPLKYRQHVLNMTNRED